MIKYSFKPIASANSRILILGTMPGEQSLSLKQYYGNPRNLFWKLLFTVYAAPFTSNYDERVAFLLTHDVAVWDVLQACERNGSLDSNIKNELPNDFDAFLKSHPNISHIFFNGQKAASFFKKYVKISDNYSLAVLPSSSPAHAGKTFENKLLEWQAILL